MSKILILGNGYLARRIQPEIPESTIPQERVEISERVEVEKAIFDHRPEIIINTAGKTGRPNIDGCELEPLETVRSNALGPIVLGKVCVERGVRLVHIGSGCIYQGDAPGDGLWKETDYANYGGSLYSLTKAVAERALMRMPVLQLRLRMPLDRIPHPRNLLDKLKSYKNVIDVPNSMTVLDDFIFALKVLLERGSTGIYNVTNPGSIRHSEILAFYKEYVDPAHSYQTISLEELRGLVIADRSNCLLSTAKLASEGIVLPEIHDAVRDAVKAYGRAIR